MPPFTELNIFAFIQVQAYLEAWFARNHEGEPTQLARWLGEQLGCTPTQIFNLLNDAHVQPDQVPALARALGHEGDAREHLRRMVALQNATDDELREALLSVWESYAAHQGIPSAEIALMLAREEREGSDEGALLPVLAVLRAHGVPMEASEVLPLLVAPVDPARVKLACEAAEAGEVLGDLRSPRMVIQRSPGGPRALSTAAWHGALNRARETLLRTRAADRSYGLQTWTADPEAEAGAVSALDALVARLARIVEETAQAPIARVVQVLIAQVRITELADRAEAEEPPSRLRLSERKSRVKERSSDTSPAPLAHDRDGRPCLYATLEFHVFARAWIAWRKARGRPCSVAWLADRMGVGATLANDLSTGRVRPKPRHVPALVRAYGLTAEEAHYLEGIARHEQATDTEDRGRERQALLRYGLAQGVRTLEGDRWRVAAHWWPRAICALADLNAFWAHPAWITLATRGRIPYPEAQDMLQALVNTGLLVPQPHGQPRPATPELDLPPADQDLAHFGLQDSVLRLIDQELLVPAPGQQLRSLVLAAPEVALPLIEAAVQTYRAEIEVLALAAQARAEGGQRGGSLVLVNSSLLFPASHPLTSRWSRRGRRR